MASDDDFGPAMLSLTEKQRGFVLAMIEFPGSSHSAAARRAGYSDTKEGAKVRGHYAAHNPAVQAAIREEAGKRLNASSLAAAGVLMKLLTDPKVAAKDRIRAAGMLLDRSGFGAAQTINVNKTVSDQSGKVILEEIKKLADKTGVPLQSLLRIATATPVIDGEFVEIEEKA
jgi:phage terminase small subunit